MTRYQELKQYVEDVETGVAMRFDDFGARLAAIENGLAAIKGRLPDQPRIDPQVVAERLGLTPTEGRVAVALAEGGKVDDIAEAMGKKVVTVRWFLGQINRKLDISTQAQLVRLVLLVPRGMAAQDQPKAKTPRPRRPRGSSRG